MENFKVYVKNDAESGLVQELLSNLGFKWMSGDDRVYFDTPNYIMAWEEKSMTVGDVRGSEIKEVTIDKLCDLVNSKKNSENEKEMNILDEGRYVEKEYINKTTGEYRKTADVVSGEQWIEVPSGAECLTKCVWLDGETYLIWWKEGFKKCMGGDNDWVKVNHSVLDYLEDGRPSVLWHRSTQPEAPPFVDDEPSLNDQYAEIKKVRQAIKVKSCSDSDHSLDAMSFGVMGVVEDTSNARKQTVEATLAERQSTYGCFEDVAFVTEGIMDLIAKVRPNGLKDIPIPHRMALYMIASKIARLANGDINSFDGWHDIGGYAKLIENLIGEEK